MTQKTRDLHAGILRCLWLLFHAVESFSLNFKLHYQKRTFSPLTYKLGRSWLKVIWLHTVCVNYYWKEKGNKTKRYIKCDRRKQDMMRLVMFACQILGNKCADVDITTHCCWAIRLFQCAKQIFLTLMSDLTFAWKYLLFSIHAVTAEEEIICLCFFTDS